jgi:hypothetical protein
MGSRGFTVGRGGEPMEKAPGGPNDTPRLGNAGSGVRIEVIAEATGAEERRPRARRMEEGAVRGEESGQGRRWREFAGRRCGHAENLGAGGAGPGKGETRSRLITAGGYPKLASASISPKSAQRAHQTACAIGSEAKWPSARAETFFSFFIYIIILNNLLSTEINNVSPSTFYMKQFEITKF